MKRPLAPEIAIEKLQTICSTSEQCTFDLRRKLIKWGLPSTQINRILYLLSKDKYVDDERFTRAFIRYSYRFSRWGKRKIYAALIAKRIPNSVISQALDEEIDMEEYIAIATELIRNKIRFAETPLPYEQKARIYRYALSRGYESSLISKILNSQTRST